MWIIGVAKEDMTMMGQLLGIKLAASEFIGYIQLAELKNPANLLHFKFEKSIIMATYMLCGFANFASIGIQIGGIGSLAPNQRKTLSEFGIKALIGGVGEVQRAIQKNSLLIRNSVINAVRAEYQTMVGSEKFRGVNPVTLKVRNMTFEVDPDIPNIRGGYNVTDKADGLRAMGFVNKEGELFLIDMSLNIYRTGLKNSKCAES